MSKTWTNQSGFNLSKSTESKIKKALFALGHWGEAAQVKHIWPNWTGDVGRFPHAINPKTNKHSVAIGWAGARFAQGLLAANKVLGGKADSFQRTAEETLYSNTRLQIYDPEYPELRGAIREETPTCFQVNPRDGMEAAMGWLAKTTFDGKKADPLWMLRTKDFLEWTVNFEMQHKGWPFEYIFFGRDASDKNKKVPLQYTHKKLRIRNPDDPISFCFAALPIPLAQYAQKTGDKKLFRKGAIPIGEWLLEKFFNEATGALQLPKGKVGHHSETLKNTKGIIGNDDGVMIALLCNQRLAPNKKKWVDPVIANADWWLSVTETPRLFGTLPAVTLLMLEVARYTGKQIYLDWVLDRLPDLLSLQYLGKNKFCHGSFTGEDTAELAKWLGCPMSECTSLRISSYLSIGLSKLLSNKKTWSQAYSSFGW